MRFYATIITCFVPSLSVFVSVIRICKYSGLKILEGGGEQFRFFLKTTRSASD